MSAITNQEAANDLTVYIQCMVQPGGSAACYRIECRHGLDGYPPDCVTVGLKAISEGYDPDVEIYGYLNPEEI